MTDKAKDHPKDGQTEHVENRQDKSATDHMSREAEDLHKKGSSAKTDSHKTDSHSSILPDLHIDGLGCAMELGMKLGKQVGDGLKSAVKAGAELEKNVEKQVGDGLKSAVKLGAELEQNVEKEVGDGLKAAVKTGADLEQSMEKCAGAALTAGVKSALELGKKVEKTADKIADDLKAPGSFREKLDKTVDTVAEGLTDDPRQQEALKVAGHIASITTGAAVAAEVADVPITDVVMTALTAGKESAEKDFKKGLEYAKTHPFETTLGALACAGAVMAGSAMTPVFGALALVGLASAVTQTIIAGQNIQRDKSWEILMNQEKYKPEEVNEARKNFKKDVGAAVAEDAVLLSGLGIGKFVAALSHADECALVTAGGRKVAEAMANADDAFENIKTIFQPLASVREPMNKDK